MARKNSKQKPEAKTVRPTLTPEQVAEALEMIRSLDWADYWRRVDEGVAKEIDAYAAWRSRSYEELGDRLLRCA